MFFANLINTMKDIIDESNEVEGNFLIIPNVSEDRSLKWFN